MDRRLNELPSWHISGLHCFFSHGHRLSEMAEHDGVHEGVTRNV